MGRSLKNFRIIKTQRETTFSHKIKEPSTVYELICVVLHHLCRKLFQIYVLENFFCKFFKCFLSAILTSADIASLGSLQLSLSFQRCDGHNQTQYKIKKNSYFRLVFQQYNPEEEFCTKTTLSSNQLPNFILIYSYLISLRSLLQLYKSMNKGQIGDENVDENCSMMGLQQPWQR